MTPTDDMIREATEKAEAAIDALLFPSEDDVLRAARAAISDAWGVRLRANVNTRSGWSVFLESYRPDTIEHYALCSYHEGGPCDFDCADWTPAKRREIIDRSNAARAAITPEQRAAGEERWEAI